MRAFRLFCYMQTESLASRACHVNSLNKISYRKQIAWQHPCQKLLAKAGGVVDLNIFLYNKLYARAAATTWPAPLLPRGRRSALRRRADGNVAASSHGQLFPTAHRCRRRTPNTAVSKAAWWPWPLTFRPWKWCPNHVWRGLLLCHF